MPTPTEAGGIEKDSRKKFEQETQERLIKGGVLKEEMSQKYKEWLTRQVIERFAWAENSARDQFKENEAVLASYKEGSDMRKVHDFQISQTAIEEIKGLIDTLTGLPNRRWLNAEFETFDNKKVDETGEEKEDESMTEIIIDRRNKTKEQDNEQKPEEKGRGKYVMIIDIDHFKEVNDKNGHTAGDNVLEELGRLLRENIREDDFVARYGGEEFCVIAGGDEKEVADFAERIRKVVEKSEFNVKGNNGETTLKLTISIGFSRHEEGDSPEKTKRNADAALYVAKKAGGRNNATLMEKKESKSRRLVIQQQEAA